MGASKALLNHCKTMKCHSAVHYNLNPQAVKILTLTQKQCQLLGKTRKDRDKQNIIQQDRTSNSTEYTLLFLRGMMSL
jgi:hypothetical protein